MKKYFEPSELIINPDGSVFHLHLHPDQLAKKIILMGDPERVNQVAAHFDARQCEVQNREFHAITGTYNGKHLTALSTGIGCDNIDIVMNELDALANIDFDTREIKSTLKSLEIVRVGTCGGLQENTPLGTFIASQKSIGFDGLLNFYQGRNEVCDLDLEKDFTNYMHWNPQLCAPYVIDADSTLLNRIAGTDMVRGITISCGGFFGPQGRELRIPLTDPEQNTKVENYHYKNLRITNYEMESSAVAGLSRLLGHRAMTCCMVIANRRALKANANYKTGIETLISEVLDRI
jgi:uridine phosphorylase